MPHPRKTPRRFAITAAAGAVLAACAPATAAVSPQDAKALNDALDDEYLAEATYQAVLDKYPGARPFINIIEAERRHAERAKAEMDRLGINYEAENRHLGKIKAPASLLEACEQGVAAEIANIALYDRLLPTITDNQVRETLTALQWASRERHLPAFQRCVARGGEMGPGQGQGRGRGRRSGT